MKVTNDPVEGRERENWLSVLPSRPMATVAARTVSGAAIPDVVASNPKLKKKLIAGAMLASVEAAISKLVRTPRARRSGASRRSVPTGPGVVALVLSIDDTKSPPGFGVR